MVPALLLVDMTSDLLDAAVRDPGGLARGLGATVADGWAGFPEALPALRDAHGPAPLRWGGSFFVLSSPRTLVGMGGFKGPPTADGIVEIGYAIAPAFQGRGLASDAARQMIRRAFADPCVRAVDAHTLAQASASTGVLEKVGFRRIGEAVDPDAGSVWHWRLPRPA
jgi:RimJ/RimL family protein N-acetyltransferase